MKKLHNSVGVKSGEWVKIQDISEFEVYDYLIWKSHNLEVSGRLVKYDRPGYIAIESNKGGEATFICLEEFFRDFAEVYGYTPVLPELV